MIDAVWQCKELFLFVFVTNKKVGGSVLSVLIDVLLFYAIREQLFHHFPFNCPIVIAIDDWIFHAQDERV